MSPTPLPDRLVIRWHLNEVDAASLVRENLRELYGVGDIVVGRLCRRCGSSGHGRPWARVGNRDVHVSWSRSEGHLVTAISPDHPVGVDVESLSQVLAAWPLEEALAPGERAGSAEEFARIWVAKEAILKAQGVGLTERMDDFRVVDFPGQVLVLDAPDCLVAAVAVLGAATPPAPAAPRHRATAGRTRPVSVR